jgi:hypothetical protein
MKVIIAGSRDITDYRLVWGAIQSSAFLITEVVSGRAKGVDRLGELYAHNHSIPVKPFNALWISLGKRAGRIRNAEMADYADAAIVIHHNSPGSLNMIDEMHIRDKPVEEHIVELPA